MSVLFVLNRQRQKKTIMVRVKTNYVFLSPFLFDKEVADALLKRKNISVDYVVSNMTTLQMKSLLLGNAEVAEPTLTLMTGKFLNYQLNVHSIYVFS